jgi:hypothetical protein
MPITLLPSLIHYLNYKITKLQHFGSCILLDSSGKKGRRGQRTYLLGSLVKQASDLDSAQGQTDRFPALFLPYYLKTEAESNSRNVVIL